MGCSNSHTVDITTQYISSEYEVSLNYECSPNDEVSLNYEYSSNDEVSLNYECSSNDGVSLNIPIIPIISKQCDNVYCMYCYHYNELYNDYDEYILYNYIITKRLVYNRYIDSVFISNNVVNIQCSICTTIIINKKFY
jgi:hypothetical protein